MVAFIGNKEEVLREMDATCDSLLATEEATEEVFSTLVPRLTTAKQEVRRSHEKTSRVSRFRVTDRYEDTWLGMKARIDAFPKNESTGLADSIKESRLEVQAMVESSDETVLTAFLFAEELQEDLEDYEEALDD